jgi:DNA-binding NarL/FixJ family response regulator
MASAEQGGKGAGQLTRREHEVIRLLRDGMSNKQIARALNISTLTAKTHVANILEKTGLNSRVQIMLRALKEQG